jgi:hypothetical protein
MEWDSTAQFSDASQRASKTKKELVKTNGQPILGTRAYQRKCKVLTI